MTVGIEPPEPMIFVWLTFWLGVITVLAIAVYFIYTNMVKHEKSNKPREMP